MESQNSPSLFQQVLRSWSPPLTDESSLDLLNKLRAWCDAFHEGVLGPLILTSDDPDAFQFLDQLLGCCRTRTELEAPLGALQAQLAGGPGLGSASLDYLGHEGRDPLRHALQAPSSGSRVRDAVLQTIYKAGLERGTKGRSVLLRNEFWSVIWSMIFRIAGASRNDRKEEHLQSVVSSILALEEAPEFRTIPSFMQYILTRLRWKEAGEHRRRRPEDLPKEEPRDPRAGPATEFETLEDGSILKDAIRKLPPRERYLIMARLDGKPMEEQAVDLELSYEAARKASQRAWRKLVDFLRGKYGDHEDPSDPDADPEEVDPDETSSPEQDSEDPDPEDAERGDDGEAPPPPTAPD